MPQVIASMDEDSKITRLMACRIVDVFLKVCGRQFDADKFKNTYTGMCKCLVDLGRGHVCFNQDHNVEVLHLLFYPKCHSLLNF